ncbi:hypothetical protein AAHA92_22575 [Salvia divinorum]|uniref:Uncharacterized protein n=1 Tax=Salvia divinorum TaxID=28513 RepID=A0ABD1GS77_SALDI
MYAYRSGLLSHYISRLRSITIIIHYFFGCRCSYRRTVFLSLEGCSGDGYRGGLVLFCVNFDLISSFLSSFISSLVLYS